MLKILDILINALVAWRSRIVINRQKQDLCCLDGKENPADAGFKPVGKMVLRADISNPEIMTDEEREIRDRQIKAIMQFDFKHPERFDMNIPEPVYFPGFTQKEIEALVKK